MREAVFVSSKSSSRSSRFVLVCVGFGAAVLLSSFNAGAQVPVVFETQKLSVSGDIPRVFGHAVDVSGEVAVIGGALNTENGFYSGSVYIYRYDGTRWVEEQRLLASDGATNHWFGWSVAISGDTAVVGSLGAGVAYIYRYDGIRWVEEQKLLGVDHPSVKNVSAVDISGEVAVVSGYEWDDDRSRSGLAYVYRYDGTRWIEEQKLLAHDDVVIPTYENFDVSISGDVLVIGVLEDGENGFLSGSAYVYRHDGNRWVEEQKLLASDGAEGDYFGASVAVSGNTALIGCHGSLAYVYRYEGTRWVEEQKLLTSDSAADLFGRSVDISGDLAVIGARGSDDYGSYSGAAYLFRDYGVGWLEEQKLLPSRGAAEDIFGRSVAVSGETAVIGAPTLYGVDYSDAAYVYGLAMNRVVDIDIVPGSDSNSINPSRAGSLPVAIFGSGSFDVEEVDVATLAFGPSGASLEHKRGPHFKDLNGDGFGDLLAHFRVEKTGVAHGDTFACITGEKLDTTPFKGCDTVRTIPRIDASMVQD